MAFSLIWLPHVLESAGLKVACVPDWENRGRAEMGEILGVICHHTAGERHGNMPTLRVLIEGREDLAGPLAQLGLGRDGTFYVIAAGRCNHAGVGMWNECTNGNSNFIGIEAENTGGANDFPWPAVQMDAYQRGVAAILKFVGRPALACAGHREYARPVGRKQDPVFDMTSFRATVASYLDGTAPTPTLIPATEPGVTGRPTLRRGDKGDLIRDVQTQLKVEPANGSFGPRTEAAVRQFQRARGLVPDGIIGPKSWAALDQMR
jgi:hypothetical protein